MGTSFVDLAFGDRGEFGFWANDGVLGIWLVALANAAAAVPGEREPWLGDAAAHWRLHGVQQFTGCMDAGLDKYVISDDRLATTTKVARCARAALVATAEDGYLRPPWLIANQLAEEKPLYDSPYDRYGLEVDRVLQVADAFIDLLGGRITTTPATSPVFPILGF